MQYFLHHRPWTKAQRSQIILRADAGLGTNANISYALWCGFQVLMKDYSGSRTKAWMRRLASVDWLADSQSEVRWLAPALVKLRLGRRLHVSVLRWLDKKHRFVYATLISTLQEDPFRLWSFYDGRGAAEGEFRTDKSGLKLHLRRKQRLHAMEALDRFDRHGSQSPGMTTSLDAARNGICQLWTTTDCPRPLDHSGPSLLSQWQVDKGSFAEKPPLCRRDECLLT